MNSGTIPLPTLVVKDELSYPTKKIQHTPKRTMVNLDISEVLVRFMERYS